MRFRGSPALRRSALGLLAGLTALLTGCATSLPQTPLDPKGPVAAEQTGLMMTSLWYAMVIGAVVTVLLVFVVLRFRAKPGQTEVPKQIHGSTNLEIIWTAIPIAILIAIAIPTVKANFATMGAAQNADMTIKVIGHQWWWEFQYPDAKDPKQTIDTANELVIPVGAKVNIELESQDVIHSFWVPKLAGKTDVIPNRLNHMWFQADEVGLYYGQCAEYCGDSHARMRFRVRVVTKDEYIAWVNDRTVMMAKGPQDSSDADITAGRNLFLGVTTVKNAAGKEIPKVSCAACHAIDGTTAKGKVGPNLSNIGDRHTVGAGILENYVGTTDTDLLGKNVPLNKDMMAENLKKWIRNPSEFKPGTVMPAHPASKLSDKELDQVVKFLMSLNK